MLLQTPKAGKKGQKAAFGDFETSASLCHCDRSAGQQLEVETGGKSKFNIRL
jgi:hypothetical protein